MACIEIVASISVKMVTFRMCASKFYHLHQFSDNFCANISKEKIIKHIKKQGQLEKYGIARERVWVLL